MKQDESVGAAALRALIARQLPGWALEQTFYTSEEIYEFERRKWLAEKWHLLAHCSEVSQAGDFIVREVLGEPLLIVRDEQGSVRAFYNVCRHRGSRICDEDGHAKFFTCPYHAWSYRLDGALRAAPALRDGINTEELGLRTFPVREVGGLILGSLRGDPQSLETLPTEFHAGLQFHGIPQARIAARRNYPTMANWKLVMENFLECHHCLPAHREFSSVMKYVAAQASPEATARWEQAARSWFQEQADRASPLELDRPARAAACAAFRAPIGGDFKTQSQDGLPVAPLMGKLSRFDGGVTFFRFEPFVYLAALNDYAVMFQVLPSGTERTEVIVTWLVNGSTGEGEVDIERMTWLWDVTTQQDKRLIERNVAGIRSRSYTPGPYSTQEGKSARFISDYLCELAASIDGLDAQGARPARG